MSVYWLGHHHRRAESRSCFWASLSPTVGTTMKITGRAEGGLVPPSAQMSHHAGNVQALAIGLGALPLAWGARGAGWPRSSPSCSLVTPSLAHPVS